MYYLIEDGMLKTTPYLEHHGVKNQKWGIRRYQNKDGSLTALGRKRLGYSETPKNRKVNTDKITKFVKGAYNLGKKGGKALAKKSGEIAADVKAKNLQKKKDKASETREGVLKNKKLFTSKELDDLEKRFQTEDRMRSAKRNQRVEMARAIGQYADTGLKIFNAVKGLGEGGSKVAKFMQDVDTYKKTHHNFLEEQKKWDDKSDKDSNKDSNKESSVENQNGGNSNKNGKKSKLKELRERINPIADKENRKKAKSAKFNKESNNDDLPEDRVSAAFEKERADLAKRERELEERSKYEDNRRKAQDEIYNRQRKILDESADALDDIKSDLDKRETSVKDRERNVADATIKLRGVSDALETFSKELGDDTLKDSKKLAEIEAHLKEQQDEAAKIKKKLKQGDDMSSGYIVADGMLIVGDPDDVVEHFGIKGMKVGIRRFQNKDGSLTPLGKERYGKGKVNTSASGGGGEDDDEKEDPAEIAKKAAAAGLSVAQYKLKMAKEKAHSALNGAKGVATNGVNAAKEAANKVGKEAWRKAGGEYKEAADKYRKSASEADKTAEEHVESVRSRSVPKRSNVKTSGSVKGNTYKDHHNRYNKAVSDGDKKRLEQQVAADYASNLDKAFDEAKRRRDVPKGTTQQLQDAAGAFSKVANDSYKAYKRKKKLQAGSRKKNVKTGVTGSIHKVGYGKKTQYNAQANSLNEAGKYHTYASNIGGEYAREARRRKKKADSIKPQRR